MCKSGLNTFTDSDKLCVTHSYKSDRFPLAFPLVLIRGERQTSQVAAKWLLIETVGGATPSIVGMGSTPRKFTALDKFFKSKAALNEVRTVIVEAMASPATIDRVSDDGRRRTIVEPLLTFAGRMHGMYLWTGSPDEVVPKRDPAGAWLFNLTASKASGSNDLLDLYAVPENERHTEKAMAGAFTRLETNSDEAEALVKIIQSAPGTIHQAVWNVRRDDDELRAAHFSCRMLEEIDPESGRREVILRGITQDIGPSIDVSAAPPPIVLEHRVLEAVTEEGVHRAICNLRTFQLIRWMGPPLPDVAWEWVDDQPEPGMHPDDIALARAMSANLARGRSEGVLRFRKLDGEWQKCHVEARLMALDQHTTAGLVTVRAAAS